MQPPIPLGTILQNRYRLIKILGQGGFGRTYLAEDLGRFNEPCALKELILAQTGYALEKSKELFQREAAILYQIQHPQVPQFRATFEQDQRLFLVQDYVEGKTYRMLLDERKASGQTFREAEVLQLLRQLLPVLAHLHIRGIIHRDISPDNIILRQSDAKSVLIDFGVVKELATRLQSPNITSGATTVGKLGYAPSEQIQTGKAYPSSDLYALAATCVVLLTGREPQELDDTQVRWNWQHWAKVSPGLAMVLNRMLSYKPSDRYQSVADLAKALQTLKAQLSNQNNPQLPTLNRQPGNPELSQIQTIAVGRRPDLIKPSSSNNQTSVIPAPKTREIWDNPWAIAAIGIFVASLTGIGSWALVSYILAQRPVPQTFSSPMISESLTPVPTPSTTPTPTPTPSTAINYSQRLNLVTGVTTSIEDSLKANATLNYIFNGVQGQQLSAILENQDVLLTVLGPNQEPINALAERVTRYQGLLPFTGDYTIQLNPVQGVERSKYKLNLSLAPVELTITPTSTPTVTPSLAVEPINFNPGETTRQISGQTGLQQIKRYLVNVQAGQELSVAVQGSVTLDIRTSNGELVENAAKVQSWQEQIPSGGEYQIDVIALEQVTDFTLNVGVRDLE